MPLANQSHSSAHVEIIPLCQYRSLSSVGAEVGAWELEAEKEEEEEEGEAVEAEEERKEVEVEEEGGGG